MHLLPVTPGNNNSRIHLLEIIGNASVGGMENYLKNFITHLPANLFQVSCICPYESPFTEELRRLGAENVFVTPIEDNPSWRSIQLAIEVARLYEIDLLHAHMPKAHVLAGITGSLVHKPVVATVHGMEITAHELGITRAINSHLTTNCQEAYTQALALGVPASRVDMVRNSVDISTFKPAEKNNEFLQALGIPPGAPVVGFVGRLDFEKGPDLFLYAAEYIHCHKPDVHFVMSGRGNMGKELEAMCRRFRLKDCVHFADWIDDIAAVYPLLDVVAHTSRSDGTSLVLLEAMACGCLTAGFDVGGVREIIENTRTGLLAGASDCEGIGRKIIQLLEQPQQAKIKMSEAARERVSKYFNIQTNMLRTAEILQTIAGTGFIYAQPSNNGSVTRKKNSKASAANLNEDA